MDFFFLILKTNRMLFFVSVPDRPTHVTCSASIVNTDIDYIDFGRNGAEMEYRRMWCKLGLRVNIGIL